MVLYMTSFYNSRENICKLQEKKSPESESHFVEELLDVSLKYYYANGCCGE